MHRLWRVHDAYQLALKVKTKLAQNGEDFVDNIFEPVFDNDGEIQHKEIELEEGNFLVILRILTILKDDSGEDWLCHNIFKFICKSHGKVCSIVIGDESCEENISQEMEEKKVDAQLIYDGYLER